MEEINEYELKEDIKTERENVESVLIDSTYTEFKKAVAEMPFGQKRGALFLLQAEFNEANKVLDALVQKEESRKETIAGLAYKIGIMESRLNYLIDATKSTDVAFDNK